MPDKNHPQVSFSDEPLILVNEKDEVLGYKDKVSCHLGDGILHRAFSIFIFNGKGQVLMQKRSAEKPLWPLFWSNSCCSHPRKGESYQIATQRRLKEELGFTTDLKFLFKFQYQARFGQVGSENELCAVYVGRYDGPVQVNSREIAEWEWMEVEALEKEMQEHPERFTPWFKMEWERMRREFWPEISALWEERSGEE
jgi:isopentenyl-diphosphate delta-isomerase